MSRVEQLSEDVTLYLGDAVEIVPSLQYDCIVSDPPYGMEFRSNFRTEKHDAIANDASSELLAWACALPAPHSRYLFCRWDNLQDEPLPKSCVTWVKNNWSMGDLEHEHGRQTEIALFYPGDRHFWPKGRPNDVIVAPRTGNEHHPTEKPVQLMRAIIEWTSGLVLDPFMGSGSTGVAAVSIGRPFVGVELDAKHFDTACRRISAELRRPGLFTTRAPKPVQEAMQL
jgi:site-specific DNA-methyltransferase (adenine-specific)